MPIEPPGTHHARPAELVDPHALELICGGGGGAQAKAAADVLNAAIDLFGKSIRGRVYGRLVEERADWLVSKGMAPKHARIVAIVNIVKSRRPR